MEIGAVRLAVANTSLKTPNQQHWTVTPDMRRATCQEFQCDDYLYGWRVRVEKLNAHQLHEVRNSGRRFRELDIAEDEHWLMFEAGQTCFRAAAHQLPLGRELYLVGKHGDVRQYDRGDQWSSDAADHTTKIVDKIKEG